ncbi:hypothetical protein QQM79_03225 [Marinobacteraceae bacterium S3BR75-40.1]
MEYFCDYHPNDNAKWHCQSCQLHYCTSCMPDADLRAQRGFCPHCGKTLQYRGAAGQVEPFWNRLPAFFRYPLGRDPLLLIAICTLVPMILSANLIGIGVSLFLFFALFKYIYRIIEHTAEGHLTPPALAEAFSGGGFAIVLKQFAVFFLMGGLVFTAGLVGGQPLAVTAMLFLLLAMPASVIVLAMEQDVIAAINPLHLMTLMARIGWPYIVLYAHLFLMMLVGGAIQDFALSHFSPLIGQPVAGFVNSYFMLIFFHMLGYLVFQYQDELGFASDHQDGETLQNAHRDRGKRLDADIDMAVKDGEYDKAQNLLVEALKRSPGNTLRLQQMYRLATARNDRATLYKQQHRLLPWLVQQQAGEGLADTLRALYAADPDFKLDDPRLAYQCAQVLYNQGEYKLLISLLRDFHKRFPEFEDLPGAYLLVAKALANGYQRWDKARAFLQFIVKKYPEHSLAKLMPHYLKQVEAKQPLEPPRRTSDA